MPISTLDISRMTTAVRRHEALLRFVRYLLIYNIAMVLWAVVSEFYKLTSFDELLALVTSPSWQWTYTVLGILFLYLMYREIDHGPAHAAKEMR